MTSRIPAALAALAALAAGTFAFAASHGDVAPAEIGARHGQMRLQSFYLSTLGNMARGNAEYDAASAQEAADSLVAISTLAWDPLWPEGTSTEEYDSSRALPAIWAEYDEFDEHWEKFGEAARALQAVAGDGLDAMRGQMSGLGQTCGDCHDDFRQSNN